MLGFVFLLSGKNAVACEKSRYLQYRKRYMPDLNVGEIIGNIRFFPSSTIVRLFGNDYL